LATLDQLPTFAEREVFHVVVESPRGSAIKLKYRPDLGAMSVSRPLATGLVYPYDWGFVPSTKGEDGDPVDAALFWDVATFPGVVVPCRALAVIQVEHFFIAATALEGKDPRILGWAGPDAALDWLRSSTT